MKLVMNEIELVEDLIEKKGLGYDMTRQVPTYLAKYYFHQGYNRKDVYDKINMFMLANCPGYNAVLCREMVDKSISYAEKHPIVCVDGISVTENEIEKICALSAKRMRRVMFAYLCIAKFNYLVNEKTNYWVGTDDKDVFRLADVKLSEYNRDLMLHELHKLGYLGFSRAIDNLNVQVLIVDNESTPVLFVKSFDDIGAQWEMFCGESYVPCVRCGKYIKKTGNRKKYCHKCARLVNIEKTTERKSKKV